MSTKAFLQIFFATLHIWWEIQTVVRNVGYFQRPDKFKNHPFIGDDIWHLQTTEGEILTAAYQEDTFYPQSL